MVNGPAPLLHPEDVVSRRAERADQPRHLGHVVDGVPADGRADRHIETPLECPANACNGLLERALAADRVVKFGGRAVQAHLKGNPAAARRLLQPGQVAFGEIHAVGQHDGVAFGRDIPDDVEDVLDHEGLATGQEEPGDPQFPRLVDDAPESRPCAFRAAGHSRRSRHSSACTSNCSHW